MQITFKAARINSGLTQKELAEKLNVVNTTLSAWESGKREPSASQLKEFAKITNVSMDDIILPKESLK